jgi:hypothetical protein
MEEPEGAEVESEKVDRAYEAKRIGFLERWSKKKQLHHRGKRKKTR